MNKHFLKELDVKLSVTEALLAETITKVQELRDIVDQASTGEVVAPPLNPMRDRIKAAKAIEEIYSMAKQAGWDR